MSRIIAVASTNPVKINAVRRAINEYEEEIDIIAKKVDPGISAMPLTKTEARIGAKNRAIRVQEETNSWLGIGNEGGVCKIDQDWYLFSTTFVWDGKKGRWGSETLIYIPLEIIKQLNGGTVELGDVMDQIMNRENVKQQEGAIGYLTGNRIRREDIFYYATSTAVASWFVSFRDIKET